MQKADGGDYGPLGKILARAMYDNLNRFIVPSLAGPARLVPLTTLVDWEFTLAALRQAAQRGRLDAIQGPDGIWGSSRKAVEEYRRTKRRRRPAWALASVARKALAVAECTCPGCGCWCQCSRRISRACML
jgi:cell filamentation protein, protein adenylyltransferase